ncbi:uncharacterized protein LOC126786934 [Argentina anserina]|uniref:uncharacterized protein LOC126786934 n=1 Tax=Argentina anserina TaxID=57926 RepID=UPI0021768912|nr:uncharacterized protein LOC126786934 [Potentilla anserina]
MPRMYIVNLNSRVSEKEVEIEFRNFGSIKMIWVARRPPDYAFIDFVHIRDAENAIRELDDKNDWRVEFSHDSRHVVGQLCTNGNNYVITKPRASGKIVSYVTNANGEAFSVFERGSVRITPTLELHNVLFDLLTREICGRGDLRDKLFHLDQTYA